MLEECGWGCRLMAGGAREEGTNCGIRVVDEVTSEGGLQEMKETWKEGEQEEKQKENCCGD